MSASVVGGGTIGVTARNSRAVPPGIPRSTDGSGAGADVAAAPVSELIEDAKLGCQTAWNALIDRFLPLVRAIARSYHLNEIDAEDVRQTVCLRLVEHLGDIREPKALPGWISTTARHESLRVAKSLRRMVPIDLIVEASHDVLIDLAGVETELLRAEQNQAVRDGLTELPAAQQKLLLLLAADPPLSYSQISKILDMPRGSIGPTRARCLKRLRETSALRGFLESSARIDRAPRHARLISGWPGQTPGAHRAGRRAS